MRTPGEVSTREPTIVILRGQRVILDSELATLYGVSTRALNQAVKRNTTRFPPDFYFRLSPDDIEGLKSQFVTSSVSWGGRRKPPAAFTEHGAVMAASVLNSPRAIQMSVFVVRAFLRLRRLVLERSELVHKLAELERRVAGHDEELRTIVSALRQLTRS